MLAFVRCRSTWQVLAHLCHCSQWTTSRGATTHPIPPLPCIANHALANIRASQPRNALIGGFVLRRVRRCRTKQCSTWARGTLSGLMASRCHSCNRRWPRHRIDLACRDSAGMGQASCVALRFAHAAWHRAHGISAQWRGMGQVSASDRLPPGIAHRATPSTRRPYTADQTWSAADMSVQVAVTACALQLSCEILWTCCV